ncbi:hypothetical protein ACQP1G_37725 [Nocardia sp. CA-107356]|uniref:hypothetical protein n=1 Tax=Nocardia sp. CA-107356 TaxID=3239972 RepID=UPI003D94FE35
MLQDIDRGRVFRAAWIAGVVKHYPGEPKPGYIASWEEMPVWEQAAAIAVYDQVAEFITVTDGNATKLSPEQKGRWVALCWIGQIHKHFPEPKPSYIADWEDMPDWQRKVDSHIFEAIEASIAAITQ